MRRRPERRGEAALSLPGASISHSKSPESSAAIRTIAVLRRRSRGCMIVCAATASPRAARLIFTINAGRSSATNNRSERPCSERGFMLSRSEQQSHASRIRPNGSVTSRALMGGGAVCDALENEPDRAEKGDVGFIAEASQPVRIGDGAVLVCVRVWPPSLRLQHREAFWRSDFARQRDGFGSHLLRVPSSRSRRSLMRSIWAKRSSRFPLALRTADGCD